MNYFWGAMIALNIFLSIYSLYEAWVRWEIHKQGYWSSSKEEKC